MSVFNRDVKRIHKDRAAAWVSQARSAMEPAYDPNSPVPDMPVTDIDFLRNEFSQRLMDRLDVRYFGG